MNRPWFQPFLAEAIGTFGLIFFGAGSIVMNEFTGGGVGLVGIALAHGVVLAVVITATAHISGGHINPAVTIGAWIGRAIDSRMAVVYIGAQLLGAVVAASLLAGLYPEAAASAANLGTPMLADGVSVSTGIMIEAILTFFLVFTVFGTAIDSRAPNLGGWAIGLVLVFDILAGGPLTGASMNPARTFGPALVGGYWTDHIVYWVGPILGGIMAAGVYSRLLMPRPDAADSAMAEAV
ncbi:MAG: MIP/aquaporin family protein [Planctomycetota bacterium]|jgi:aquaporin Z